MGEGVINRWVEISLVVMSIYCEDHYIMVMLSLIEAMEMKMADIWDNNYFMPHSLFIKNC